MKPITPNTTNNSGQPADASTAVWLCFTTYSTSPATAIDEYLPGWKIVWNGIETFDGNYAFVASDATGDTYALTIRGSLPPQDIFKKWDVFANWILEDLNVVTQAKWPYSATSGALVSSGAYLAFTNMEGMKDSLGSGLSLIDFLQKNVIGAGKKLLITGHSLGGNMVNVYASYLISQITVPGYVNNNLSVYTFAAPASGNSIFAKDLDSKLANAYHYQNVNDIIPNCPVAERLILTGLLYIPQPAAAQITTVFKGMTVSLQEAFLMLGGIFLLYDYQQENNHYTVFGTSLYSEYEQNTLQDWLTQAGAQHALSNYAGFLGVDLPIIPNNFMVQPLVEPVLG